ncbi:MAG: preprotein translocase subunit SecE [Deltaproteobacteria bacterium]|nr:preprotein translocase subunit SecE [Deltaproteobacteria bacterium]
MAGPADRTESKPVKAVKKEEKKPEKKVEKKGADSDKPGPVRQLIDFLSDVRRELKKVSWPTRADTMASTWIIIALTFIVSVYLFFCDSILQLLMRLAFA